MNNLNQMYTRCPKIVCQTLLLGSMLKNNAKDFYKHSSKNAF